MKAGDFFRNGGRYLDRMDTFFDKALKRNGKENRFSTDIGVVEVAGFTVTRKNAGKYITSPFQDFHDIKGNSGKENSAKMLFDANTACYHFKIWWCKNDGSCYISDATCKNICKISTAS